MLIELVEYLWMGCGVESVCSVESACGKKGVWCELGEALMVGLLLVHVCRKWHPDRNPDDPTLAEKKFREVGELEGLSTLCKRKNMIGWLISV